MQNNITNNTDEEYRILYERRSAEANEILGSMPSWITRWGITVTGLFLLLFLVLANFIKYPYTIKAKVVIVNSNDKLTATGVISPRYYTALRLNQTVSISLDDFPAQEFGYIEGLVIDIPDSSIDSRYIFSITLGHQLKTTNSILIPYHKVLNGTGDILIDDRSILARILENVML